MRRSICEPNARPSPLSTSASASSGDDSGLRSASDEECVMNVVESSVSFSVSCTITPPSQCVARASPSVGLPKTGDRSSELGAWL